MSLTWRKSCYVTIFIFLHLNAVVIAKDVMKCKRKLVADIVFVLDSSASIHKEQFQQQLQFVEDVVDQFPISTNEIRVGLLTYSYHVYPAFNLSTFNSINSLKRGIQRAKYAGQGTFTAQAIAYTREIMFSNKSGGRQNVPEIMIIITDGISENQTATISEAKTAKLKGIKIIVVGIGNGVDKTELQTISSDPSSKFMINVNSYGKLDTIIDMLAGKACTESKQKIVKEVKAPVHRRLDLDLMFLYDELGIKGKSEKEIRKSIILMVKQLQISKSKVSFSLLSRVDTSSPQRRTIFLSNLHSRKTRSRSFKRLLKSLYKTIKFSSRKRNRKVVIVFNSGKQLQNKRIFQELKRLSGVSELYIVNLSKRYILYDKTPDLCLNGKHCIYTIDRERSLNDILGSIKQQICHSKYC